jgi:hypothetical protein
MTGDKITGVFYATREDGKDLYRYAVPNKKDEETGEWLPPKKKIMQAQTGRLYDEAIDVEGSSFDYYETEIPVNPDDPDPEPEPEPEPDPDALTLEDTLDMLNQMGVDTDDQ